MKSKQKEITATWIAVTLTAVFRLDTALMRRLILIVTVLGTIIVLRVKTRKQEN